MNKIVIGLLIFAVISILMYIILSYLTSLSDGFTVILAIIAGASGEWLFYKQKS